MLRGHWGTRCGFARASFRVLRAELAGLITTSASTRGRALALELAARMARVLGRWVGRDGVFTASPRAIHDAVVVATTILECHLQQLLMFGSAWG